MPVRVGVNPDLLRWARARSGLPEHTLHKRFPQLDQWEQGALEPTLKQLEAFARVTHAPIGYLFLEAEAVAATSISPRRRASVAGSPGRW